MLATLDRRPEAYHADSHRRPPAITRPSRSADGSRSNSRGLTGCSSTTGIPARRSSIISTPIDVTLDDLIACRETELGDFVTGTYLAKVQRDVERVRLVMERPGVVGGHSIRLRKTIELSAGSPSLVVHYQLEDLPRDAPLHFAVEINLAAMAGHAPDRYYSDPSARNSGCLTTGSTCSDTSGLALTDEWLDLSIGLTWSQSASLWCFPIETVSQCEGSFEGVFQSSAVIPHWHVVSDENGRWDVQIHWRLDRIASTSPTRDAPASTSPRTNWLPRIVLVCR